MKTLPPAVDVYGVGTFGQRLAHALVEAGVDVRSFIDRRPPSDSLAAPFRPVDEVGDWDLPVVLGICNPVVDLVTLSSQLRQQGAEQVLSPVSTAIALNRRGVLVENYWLTGGVGIYGREQSAIESARTLLADDESVGTFDAILAYRSTGDMAALAGVAPRPDLYHPAGLAFEGRRMRYIDGGAFDGDTVRDLRHRHCDVEALLAFEPDRHSWKEATAELDSWGGVEWLCLNEALGSKPAQLRFNGSGLASAAVDASGETVVTVVALDDVAPNWRPSHIKLDVEGAEPDALLGATRLLREYLPRLAISVYHRPDHLWSLLHQLNDLSLGYRFWLRCHGEQTFDVVLYCATESITEGVTAA